MKDDGDPQNIRGRYNIHVLIKGPGELKPLRNELSGFQIIPNNKKKLHLEHFEPQHYS